MSSADPMGHSGEVAAAGRVGEDHPGMGDGPQVWRNKASSAVAAG